ncbi:hypothetical protein B9Z55_026840 [Caenorhabditis nigoni]|uniref:Nuclear receptor domain-containing protein n=1 Tax=Caenorhabditis nigoni TaxID=1611254 RepID=A0A2G5SI34_9PELO|nr:hypothetical protein B9Z55_026840 [Caenorhabditis nigoni]
MPNCSVCSNPLASYHFGAIVCRACAAFFRRYVHRKRILVICKCLKNLRDSRFPCRLCRLKKCLSVGMQKSRNFWFFQKLQ